MKRTTLIILASLITYIGQAKNDTLKVESQIKQVTVFLQGGEIVRQSNLGLPKGTIRVLFSKLSPNIDVNSIQLKSNQDITILSVVHQYNFLDQVKKSEKVEQLEKKKKEKKKKKRKKKRKKRNS